MKRLNEITVIGTAREIRSLYTRMSRRWDTGRSSWAPLYSDKPRFDRRKIYGIVFETEEGAIGLSEGAIGLSGRFVVVGEHFIVSQLL